MSESRPILFPLLSYMKGFTNSSPFYDNFAHSLVGEDNDLVVGKDRGSGDEERYDVYLDKHLYPNASSASE